MRISEITSTNKPYIRITKGKKKIDIPITPKVVLLPPSQNIFFKDCAYVGCENIRFLFKGKRVKINWTFNHNKMTLFCSSGRKAYSWNNVRVATITTNNGKKEHLVICKRAYGDETERRRYKRYPIIKAVTIMQGDRKISGSTVDISYGGMGVSVQQNVKIVSTEPIKIDFGQNKPVIVRLVRTTFKDDGSAVLGCAVSPSFKQDLVKIITDEEAKNHPQQKETSQKDTDKGWTEGSIKRWH